MIDRKHTPLELMIGLHYYCSPYPYAVHDQAHANSPAVNSIKDMMLGKGLLVDNGEGDAKAGPALKTWIEAICSVPFPVMNWVIPEGDDD